MADHSPIKVYSQQIVALFLLASTLLFFGVSFVVNGFYIGSFFCFLIFSFYIFKISQSKVILFTKDSIIQKNYWNSTIKWEIEISSISKVNFCFASNSTYSSKHIEILSSLGKTKLLIVGKTVNEIVALLSRSQPISFFVYSETTGKFHPFVAEP